MNKPFAIYADIGGTNSRIAVQMTETSAYEQVKIYPSINFNAPCEVILQYLADQGLDKPEHIAIAIACPITDDALKMANLHWTFSIAATKKNTGVNSVHFINDFEALVLSLPHLGTDEQIKIGQGEAIINGTMALIGPGTGVGVASLIHTGSRYQALPCEGGHVLYPPQDLEEIEIVKVVMQEHPIVSVEHLLSGGRGIINLIKGVATVHGQSIPLWTPKELFEQGLIHQHKLAIEILSRYCAMLGNVAGNLALTVGAHGGMYIGGGLVPRLGDFFVHSRFRECFEKKDLADYYVKAMPTIMVTAEFPALLGAQCALHLLLNKFN